MFDDGRENGESTERGPEGRRRPTLGAGLGVGASALSAAVLTIGAVSGALPLGPLFTWLLSMAIAAVVAVAAVSVVQVRRLRAALAEERRRLRAFMDHAVEHAADGPAGPFETAKVSSFATRH